MALRKSPSLHTLDELWLAGNCLDGRGPSEQLAGLISEAPRLRWLDITDQRGQQKIGVDFMFPEPTVDGYVKTYDVNFEDHLYWQLHNAFLPLNAQWLPSVGYPMILTLPKS